MVFSNGSRSWPRRIHTIVGITASLNLLILLASGLLMQHRDRFGLEERLVSRSFLPGSYRPDDGPEGVRADIVVTDLHSGRLFGAAGLLILDLATILWAVLLLSGIFIFVSKQLRYGSRGEPSVRKWSRLEDHRFVSDTHSLDSSCVRSGPGRPFNQ